MVVPMVTLAQKFSVKGQLVDTLSSPMPSATVMLLQSNDSTLASFGVTDGKGFFEIKNIIRGEYLLKVSFVGFATLTRKISPQEGLLEMNLGTLEMEPKATELDEVVVEGDVPVTVKRDTIEFNAGSFKTRANANVEDLLKKLPGIDVESDGTVRAQGETVQRVTVDGKEFFGRDPKLATRNLPADAVDKVQVFDRKSDQAQFTGVDDGQREKTINLELKEEKRNGAFGTMMAGAGSNDRFQARGNLNRFSKGKQFSFLAMGNNVNEQGFSISDYMNFSGGAQQMMGGGGGRMQLTIDGNGTMGGVPLNTGGRPNGIMTNYAGGVNFNQAIDKKTDVSGSYFYSQLNQNVDRTVERINYLPKGDSYTFNQESKQRNNNENHRLNFVLDHRMDSSNSIRFNAIASYNGTNLATFSSSETKNPQNQLLNTSDNNNLVKGTGVSINSNLLYRHRFNKKGRSFSTNVNFVLGQNASDGELIAENGFFSGPSETQNVQQTNDQASENLTVGTTVSFVEPLGNRKYLEGSYNYRTNRNDVEREVYDLFTGTPAFNDMLSNSYVSNFTYHRPALNLRINRKKFNLSLGSSWQSTNIAGELLLREIDINNSFSNVLPNVRFNYDFSNLKHLRIDYEANVQEPTIQQLQPVIDNTTSQINQSIGNPDLRPGYAHTGSMHFTTFDPAVGLNFFAIVSGTYTKDAISYSQTINPDLSTLTMPVNVRDAVNLRGNFNFGFQIRKIFSRVNVGPAMSLNRNRVLLNGNETQSESQNLGGSARYNFTYKDFLTIDLSANLSKQDTRYASEASAAVQNQSYFNKTYSAETNLTILKNWLISGTLDYMMFDSQTTGFSQVIPLLNLSLSRFILKAQSGEIKVGVVNALDRSFSVSQQSSVNYLETITYNNLGRYFMVSFTYSLNKQLNPMGNRRPGGGGARMIIRD